MQIFATDPAGQDPELGRRQAEALKGAGFEELACQVLEDLLEIHPDWLEGYMLRSLWRTGDADTLALITRARPRFVARGDAGLIRGLRLREATCRWRMGETAVAREIAAELLAEAPNNVAFLDLSGHLAMAHKDYDAAVSAFERAFVVAGEPRHARDLANARRLAKIRPEFRGLQFSGLLLQHMVDARRFETVLDIGSGAGEQARVLRAHGKHVTELDYGGSIYFQRQAYVEAKAEPGEQAGDEEVLIGDFLEIEIDRQFDCVLASHVLEHQLNVGLFLGKVHRILREGGTLAISVPPLKPQIVGGHVTLWNAGLLLYNLVLAGFDCRAAWVRRYGYNISLAVEKRTISPEGLVFDNGDVDRIAQWLPEGLCEGFNGEIAELG